MTEEYIPPTITETKVRVEEHYPPGYHWDGKYIEMDVTDWWCPTDNNWCMCPGPCPDGQEHIKNRTRTIKAKQMVLDEQLP